MTREDAIPAVGRSVPAPGATTGGCNDRPPHTSSRGPGNERRPPSPRDPRRYGFSPPPEAPHETEILHVSQPTEIRQIAEAAGTTVKYLRELNPELVGPATPPDQRGYALRIPRRVTWVSHKVQEGETLTAIARRYKVSLQMLREANRLNQRAEPAVGRIILVPAKPFPPPA